MTPRQNGCFRKAVPRLLECTAEPTQLNWVEDFIGPFLSRVGAGQWYDTFKAGNFWTSTTLDKTHACTFAFKYFFSANQPPKNDEKTKKCEVIPFIAFTVTQ